MFKSLKLNQRNIFDLIPGMTVIFSDDDLTTTSSVSDLDTCPVLVHSIHRLHKVLLLSYIERVPSDNNSTDDIPNIGHSIGYTKANH